MSINRRVKAKLVVVTSSLPSEDYLVQATLDIVSPLCHEKGRRHQKRCPWFCYKDISRQYSYMSPNSTVLNQNYHSDSIRMVRHIIRVNRTTDSNGSNRSISGTLLFRIHSIFILLLSYLACLVQNSMTEMSKGPSGGITFGRFHHAIRPIL